MGVSGATGQTSPLAALLSPTHGDHLSLITELILFDLPVQRRQSYIEQAGCLRLISPGVVQDALYMQFFHACQVECRQRPRGPNAGNLQVSGQVLNTELCTVREDDGSFDDIF